MAKNPLFDLYEKLYFHEIEVREKLGDRLQAPMAIIASLIGVVAFLIQNFEKDHGATSATTFLVLMALSAVVLLASIYFFVRSWYGNIYAFLPSAEATENYQKLLQDTYSPYPEGSALAEKYLHEYICSYYISCATRNTQSNDKRALSLHRTNGTLIVATALVASSFLVFFLGDLNGAKINRPTEVVIVNPVNIKGIVMADQKNQQQKEVQLPLPPPPPPPRLIKEGVEIVKPVQEKKDGK